MSIEGRSPKPPRFNGVSDVILNGPRQVAADIFNKVVGVDRRNEEFLDALNTATLEEKRLYGRKLPLIIWGDDVNRELKRIKKLEKALNIPDAAKEERKTPMERAQELSDQLAGTFTGAVERIGDLSLENEEFLNHAKFVKDFKRVFTRRMRSKFLTLEERHSTRALAALRSPKARTMADGWHIYNRRWDMVRGAMDAIGQDWSAESTHVVRPHLLKHAILNIKLPIGTEVEEHRKRLVQTTMEMTEAMVELRQFLRQFHEFAEESRRLIDVSFIADVEELSGALKEKAEQWLSEVAELEGMYMDIVRGYPKDQRKKIPNFATQMTRLMRSQVGEGEELVKFSQVRARMKKLVRPASLTRPMRKHKSALKKLGKFYENALVFRKARVARTTYEEDVTDAYDSVQKTWVALSRIVDRVNRKALKKRIIHTGVAPQVGLATVIHPEKLPGIVRDTLEDAVDALAFGEYNAGTHEEVVKMLRLYKGRYKKMFKALERAKREGWDRRKKATARQARAPMAR